MLSLVHFHINNRLKILNIYFSIEIDDSDAGRTKKRGLSEKGNVWHSTFFSQSALLIKQIKAMPCKSIAPIRYAKKEKKLIGFSTNHYESRIE